MGRRCNFFGDGKIIAKAWDGAAVDRLTGTVAGWKLGDGTTERLDIEVLWNAARDYGDRRVPRSYARIWVTP